MTYCINQDLTDIKSLKSMSVGIVTKFFDKLGLAVLVILSGNHPENSTPSGKDNPFFTINVTSL